MAISPHQLQEDSPPFLAWQKCARDDFDGFLTCRAREFKKNGILALVIAARPNCLEGIAFFNAEYINTVFQPLWSITYRLQAIVLTYG